MKSTPRSWRRRPRSARGPRRACAGSGRAASSKSWARQQLAAAVGMLGDDVELDRVDAGAQRGLETTRTCCRARCGRRPCGRRGACGHVWHPAHQYVMRLSSPWPRLRDRRRRSAGTAGRRGRRPARWRSCMPSSADCCIRGARRAHDRAAPRRRRPRRRGARGRWPPRSSPRHFHMLPMPAIVRWSSSASPIGARRVVLAQAAQEALLVELRREDVGAELRRGGGRSACATRSAARARGPSNWTTSPRGGAQHEPGAARARGASAAPSR